RRTPRRRAGRYESAGTMLRRARHSRQDALRGPGHRAATDAHASDGPSHRRHAQPTTRPDTLRPRNFRGCLGGMMDAAAVTVGGGSCSADQRCSVARGLRPCIWRYWTAKRPGWAKPQRAAIAATVSVVLVAAM